MSQFPMIQFYDYTKRPQRVTNYPNYHLTFSRSESNNWQNEMRRGRNVAIVFNTKKGNALPETYKGYRVIDGDQSDLRFLDPINCIVGLRAKGKAKHDHSGFVVQPED